MSVGVTFTCGGSYRIMPTPPAAATAGAVLDAGDARHAQAEDDRAADLGGVEPVGAVVAAVDERCGPDAVGDAAAGVRRRRCRA